jgi:hypothetical protein
MKYKAPGMNGLRGRWLVSLPSVVFALSFILLAPPREVTLTIRHKALRLEDGENSFRSASAGSPNLRTQVLYGLDASGEALRAAQPHTRLAVGDEVTARLPSESLWALGD